MALEAPGAERNAVTNETNSKARNQGPAAAGSSPPRAPSECRPCRQQVWTRAWCRRRCWARWRPRRAPPHRTPASHAGCGPGACGSSHHHQTQPAHRTNHTRRAQGQWVSSSTQGTFCLLTRRHAHGTRCRRLTAPERPPSGHMSIPCMHAVGCLARQDRSPACAV